jgi:hypothetical protein
MGFQYDVLSAHTDASGTMVANRARLKAYQAISGGTAGEIIFKNGGASGETLMRFNISTGVQPISLLIPGDGILFNTDIYVTLPASAKITIFYG